MCSSWMGELTIKSWELMDKEACVTLVVYTQEWMLLFLAVLFEGMMIWAWCHVAPHSENSIDQYEDSE